MGRFFFAHVHQVLQQHAEGRAPVADMVFPDDLVALQFQQADQAVADYGRPQVADVHLLGRVGGGVVHYHGQGTKAPDDAEAMGPKPCSAVRGPGNHPRGPG